VELPDEFYDLDESMARSMLASFRRSAQLANVPLEERALRAAQSRQLLERHPTTVLRVRLPDRVLLQARFHSTDTVGMVYDVVRDCFDGAGHPAFELFTAPPRTVLIDRQQTLFDAGLVPAAMVNLAWRTAALPPALRAPLLASATRLQPPPATAAPDAAAVGAGAGAAADVAGASAAGADGMADDAGPSAPLPPSTVGGTHRDPPKPKWLKLGPKV